MARKFLTNLDLSQNQILNATLQNLAAAPSTPVPGQVYFDTAQNRPYLWNGVGAAWQWAATNSDNLNGQAPAYYLARANHTGTQVATTISNLQATVISYTLDTFAAPVNPVSMNGQRVTGVAAPTLSTDAANKQYVDSTAQGLTPKPTARAATTTPLPTNVYANGTAGVGSSLTATANGVLTIDGYAVALNDVVLVKNEATAANNGLYTLTGLGSAGAPYVLTRHVDMDQSAEFGGGFVPVENLGAVNANSLWLCNVANAITVGTTAVSFTQLNSATVITGASGVSVSGNVASGVVLASGGVLVGAGGFYLDTTVAARKYVTAVGDGSSTSITVTHNLGTQDVVVGVYLAASPYSEVECDVAHTTGNTLTLAFATAPGAGLLRCVVHG
jgi:hypothetical protein